MRLSDGQATAIARAVMTAATEYALRRRGEAPDGASDEWIAKPAVHDDGCESVGIGQGGVDQESGRVA